MGRAVNGVWPPQLSQAHINYLELLAVFLAVKHFRKFLQGQHVLIKTDNSTVVAYINRQGRHTLAAATQADMEASPVVQHPVFIPSRHTCARDTKHGGGSPVKGKSFVRRLETSPASGGSAVAEIRPGIVLFIFPC